MVFGLGCQRERLYKPLYIAHLFILAGVVYYYFQGSVGKPAPDHEIAGEPSQGSVAVVSTNQKEQMIPHSCEQLWNVAQRSRVDEWWSQVQEPGAEASTPSPGWMLDAHRGHVLDSVLSICSVAVNLTAAQQLALSVGGKQAPRGTVTGSRPPKLVGETLRPVWGLMDKCYPVTTQRRRAKGGKKQASEAMPPKSGAAPREETELWSQHEGEVRPPAKEAASPSPGPAAKGVAEEEEGAGTPGWEENTKVRKEIAVYASEASEVDSKEERPGGWVPQLLRKLWLDWFPAPEIPKTQNHE
ncbi:hypothetical protein PANDA_016420 [Ailuropoda melanoleuca]|uniref:Uncharacterized protein n=1 Tax=Ailuropoda melanoleuca TaxID=9646 RepID=D2HVL4_AILME|nr:hypothetical protein PANDA_016420 [Ailuropoda melanoleuca]